MKLPRDFYLQDTLTTAKSLLGKHLVRVSHEGITSGRIIETEAYGDRRDKASHVFGGKITERTKIWFEIGGHAYVYTIYGMHRCLGIIAEDKFKPGAILIRALEPTDGLDLMHKRRGTSETTRNSIYQLCSGPSKICQALSITKDLYGQDLYGDTLFIEDRGDSISENMISTSPRIGINYAGEAAHYNWRFYLKDNPYLSVKNYTGPKTVQSPEPPLLANTLIKGV